jgi:hypothetical protein
MCDVYSNATLTIAAASVTGDHESFLKLEKDLWKIMANTFPSHPELASNLEIRWTET